MLSARQDDFFRRNQHSNFGDLGTAIKVCPNPLLFLQLVCACCCMWSSSRVEP